MGIFFKILGIVGIVLACAVGLVILVIAALLPAKVKVRIGYLENEFILSFKLLFFRYTVAPEKAKKKKKAKKSEGWLSLHFLFANFLRFMAANLSLTQIETWARPR